MLGPYSIASFLWSSLGCLKLLLSLACNELDLSPQFPYMGTQLDSGDMKMNKTQILPLVITRGQALWRERVRPLLDGWSYT